MTLQEYEPAPELGVNRVLIRLVLQPSGICDPGRQCNLTRIAQGFI